MRGRAVHGPPPPLLLALLLAPCRCGAQRDVFAFHTGSYGANKSGVPPYPWDRIAAVCVFSENLALRDAARRGGAKYIAATGLPETRQLPDASVRAGWVAEQVAAVQSRGLDGLNIDFEDAVKEGSAEQRGLSAAVAELAAALRAAAPHAELSFDAAVRPCYEGRCYDYANLSASVDRLFVMAYDLNDYDDPPRDNDHSYANSPLRVADAGLRAFAAAGVDMAKVTLGVPWYGYRYKNMGKVWVSNDQVGYKDIAPLITDAGWEQRFDNDSMTPYLVDRKNSGNQVWYDDPDSLRRKARLAGSLGATGVGMWTANAVDYADASGARAFWDAMSLRA